MKIDIKGYVNSVRESTTLESGQTVGSIQVGVPYNRDKETGKSTYQSVQVSFWGKNSTKVNGLKEKQYILIPDATVTEISSAVGKDKETIYTNIKAMAYDIFISTEGGTTTKIKVDDF